MRLIPRIFKSLSVLSLSLLISGCDNKNPHPTTISPEVPVSIRDDSRIPVESFVFVEMNLEYDECSPAFGKCRKQTRSLTSSAALIAKSEKENLSVIITAGHTCKVAEEGLEPYQTLPGMWMFPKNQEVNFVFRDFAGGDDYHPVVHAMSKNFDLCLMSIRGIVPFDPITFAQDDVEIGSKVFNIAAPSGIWSPKSVPIFEGFYSGIIIKGEKTCVHESCDSAEQDLSVYTLPILQGSSGSPVINDDFDIVGIVVSMPLTRKAAHVGFGTTHNDIIGFVDEKLPAMLVNPDDH